MASCNVMLAGQIDYIEAWDKQRALASAREVNSIDDTLIILEHPHTYTVGRSADGRANLLYSESQLHQHDIVLVEVDRGGDITYHGPGQMVAYPVRYLGQVNANGRLGEVDYVGYLRKLEAVIIGTLSAFSISAQREAGYTGVWVDTAQGLQKIAAIGVRVSARGVSTHGTALNISTDLSLFSGIIPCGISDRAVTSMKALLGSSCPPQEEVIRQFISEFARVFDYDTMREVTFESLP